MEILIEFQFTDVRNATLTHGKRKRIKVVSGPTQYIMYI